MMHKTASSSTLAADGTDWSTREISRQQSSLSCFIIIPLRFWNAIWNLLSFYVSFTFYIAKTQKLIDFSAVAVYQLFASESNHGRTV